VQEQPAHVRVRQAAQRTAPADAVIDVRAVGIARLVGEGVVLAMVGHPRDDRSLYGRRARHGQDAAQPPLGGERAVGEQPVEADGHAEAREHVEDPEDGDVAPVQQRVPHLPADDAECKEGHDADRPGRDAVQRLVLGWLDVVRAWL
jgi:hypothetical protein